LLPLEWAICVAALTLRQQGTGTFHGYQLAKRLADGNEARSLTGYGTLYRALARLETMGLVGSEWEDPVSAAQENRPRRRLYALTPRGERAAAEAPAGSGNPAGHSRWLPTHP
jgi:DNA-binding PadR family transcriptional regulator